MGRAFVQSEKLNPHLRTEDQDMEMVPTVFGPPAFGSPNPETEGGRLVPLNDHPLKQMMDDDYARDHLESGADGGAAGTPVDDEYEALTVEELDDKYGDEEGYPKSANKAEKVAFARQSDKG